MRAAYLLEEKDGTVRMRKLAQELDQRGRVDAARSLLEGLEDIFTINRLGLPAGLRRCLATTNIIENPNGGVRARCRRVKRWKDPRVILRWCAAAFLECEARFRKISGHSDLWVLEAQLRELEAQHREPAAADLPLARDLEAA